MKTENVKNNFFVIVCVFKQDDSSDQAFWTHCYFSSDATNVRPQRTLLSIIHVLRLSIMFLLLIFLSLPVPQIRRNHLSFLFSLLASPEWVCYTKTGMFAPLHGGGAEHEFGRVLFRLRWTKQFLLKFFLKSYFVSGLITTENYLENQNFKVMHFK